jgi:hypothetical protein
MTKFTINHDDHDTTAPMRASLIAVFPVLLNSSLIQPNTYISAQTRITPRLIYPTNERRVSAIPMMIQGISPNEILPVRRSLEFTQLPHSRMDVAARLTRVASRKRRTIIRIRVR